MDQNNQHEGNTLTPPELLFNSDLDSSSQASSKEDVNEKYGEGVLSICQSTNDTNCRMENTIYLTLCRIFQEEIPSDFEYQRLNNEALAFIHEILKKKFKFDSNFVNFELIKARRRHEEQFKFVIKKGFKRLFKNFKKMRNGFVKGDKIMDEMEFYSHYFGEMVGYDKVLMEGYFLPGSKIQKVFTSSQTKIDKTVSIAYLSRVFRSDLFRKDFVSYLLNYFVPEYIQTRNQKLLKISMNYTLRKRLKSNKLPWTKTELENAQKCFVNFIYSL